MEKLAVIALGKAHSGKSYTWKVLLDAPTDEKLYSGAKKVTYLDKNKYVNVCVINSSPQEHPETPLKKRIKTKNPITKEPIYIVLCSVQCRETGQETFNYFLKNGYSLCVHLLNPKYSNRSKLYRECLCLVKWLQSQNIIVKKHDSDSDAQVRVNEIRKCIYNWAKARGLLLNSKK